MSNNSAHWSFWVLGILMLIWNVMGCLNFLMQMNPEIIASYRDFEQALILNRPLWATLAFAIAVFGGAIGCILLLFKKTISFYVLIASFIGTVITMAHTLNANIYFSFGDMIAIIILPILIATFLIGYEKYSERKGWLKN